MRHIFSKSTAFSFLIVFALCSTTALHAQSADQNKSRAGKDKKTTIRVRVSEDVDGKVKDVEKEYHVKSMSEGEKKEFVDKVLDSLGSDSKSGKTISVTVDEGDGEDQNIVKKRRKVIVDGPEDRDAFAFHWNDDWANRFEFDSEKFRSQIKNFEKEFKPKARVMIRDMEKFGDQMGDFWNKEITKPATVREISVYPNNPDNGTLNLRFRVPEKGEVSITITDTKGKEVGKKEIKDFSGDFVGQVELKKNTKGTVFVTVVQNEDGAVKRVVIP